jgi:hypothetical protein
VRYGAERILACGLDRTPARMQALHATSRNDEELWGGPTSHVLRARPFSMLREGVPMSALPDDLDPMERLAAQLKVADEAIHRARRSVRLALYAQRVLADPEAREIVERASEYGEARKDPDHAVSFEDYAGRLHAGG